MNRYIIILILFSNLFTQVSNQRDLNRTRQDLTPSDFSESQTNNYRNEEELIEFIESTKIKIQ